MIELDWVTQCVQAQTYFYSAHPDKERLADNLMLGEVEEAIQNGVLPEQYEDTGRGPSCLVDGFTALNKPVHSVIQMVVA